MAYYHIVVSPNIAICLKLSVSAHGKVFRTDYCYWCWN